VLPAVDPGKSVSRVGGKTQLAAYRREAAELRLAHAQYEELETFARFGTRLDEETRRDLEHGRRVREVLKQPQYHPMSVCQQVSLLVAVNAGLLDDLPLDDVAEASRAIRRRVPAEHPEICRTIRQGESLEEEAREAIVGTAREAILEALPGVAPTGEGADDA
jgi:F-type H+-transporting ATPase subunit alpha